MCVTFVLPQGEKEGCTDTSFRIVGPHLAPSAHQDQRRRRAYAQPSGLMALRANNDSSGRL
jgi:hypothetical protein